MDVIPIITTEKYMPVLDDPILPLEVETAIKVLKSNKAARSDGLSPGTLKLLTASWIMLITTLFNLGFDGSYIPAWLSARFVTLYKKDRKISSKITGG